MGNRFDVQENWPPCLQSAPRGPDGRCRWWYWGSSSTESTWVLHPCVQVWVFFIPGPPVALAFCQFSNKVSPSKSPLPIAFPGLLCHRHFSTSLAFLTPPEANHKLGIWSRNPIWKMIPGSMMQKCGSETVMGEDSKKLVLMSKSPSWATRAQPHRRPSGRLNTAQKWAPTKARKPNLNLPNVLPYFLKSAPGLYALALVACPAHSRASSSSQRDLQGVAGTVCRWPAG